jgi:hypothetical protein
VGSTTDRELHPAPKVKYSIERIIFRPVGCVNSKSINIATGAGFRPAPVSVQLRFDNAIYRADIHTFRGIKVTDALHASGSIDDIDVTIGNRIGGAFWQASAASNAIVLNFHSHGITLLFKMITYTYTFLSLGCQMTYLFESGQICHVFM